MKQLIWKEWYELRRMPWVLAVAVSLCAVVSNVASIQFGQKPDGALSATMLILLSGMSALVAGAGLFSQEIGNDGLVFLSILPVSRRRIWWVKVGIGLGMVLISILASTLAWAVTNFAFEGSSFFNGELFSGISWSSVAGAVGICILSVLSIYMVAVFVSPSFDRVMPAICAAIAATVLCYIIIMVITGVFDAFGNGSVGEGRIAVDAGLFRFMLIALSLPIFMIVSYMTFTRGESLRTSKRLVVGAKSLGVCVAAAIVILWAGVQLRWW